MMHVVEATDGDGVRVPPVIDHVQVFDWVGERSSAAFGLWGHGRAEVLDRHTGFLGQRDFVLMARCDLEIRLRFLLVVDVNDAWQHVWCLVSILVEEVVVTFCRLLVKILPVEWMTLVVCLAMRDIPPIVPVFASQGLLALNLAVF
jgi:hypothetical protein